MSGIQNSQIPVFRVYFSIEIRRKISGPRVAFGGDRIPVLSDSGILKLYCNNITIYVRVSHFYDLSALVGCWSSVSIKRIIYKFLNVFCVFTAVAVSGKVERS